MSLAKSHEPPSSRIFSMYRSASSSIRGWRCRTDAGLNQSLVTARWSRCAAPSRCTSVAGSGMPLASISRQSSSRPSTDCEVFSQRVLSLLTAKTSACRVSTQNGVKPSSSTRYTGSVRRISATCSCQRSMSAQLVAS